MIDGRRRQCLQAAALALAPSMPAWAATARPGLDPAGWREIEAGVGGRLGVAVRHPDGRLEGHRLDERFPMCSSFKWFAAALVLHRVERGEERLERQVDFGPEVLLPHSPVTAQHAGRGGLSVAQLCEAAITVSDNAATNLLLDSFGGPQALTDHARRLGDTVTRLDRREPALNEARPGDPRDTTSPRAMAALLHGVLEGNALSPASRQRLAGWMEATRTNLQRLRVPLPEGWRMGSKTGTGPRGTTNDVGLFWPPAGGPIVVAAYLTETEAPEAERNRAIAEVARRVVAAA